MPRGKLSLTTDVEYLSILDEQGNVEEGLVPDLADDVLEKFHRSMLLARRFDERLLNLQRQGRLGTFAPVKGQEAAQIGSIAALGERDWMVPSYRETAVQIWRGTPLEGRVLDPVADGRRTVGSFDVVGFPPTVQPSTISVSCRIPVATSAKPAT